MTSMSEQPLLDETIDEPSDDDYARAALAALKAKQLRDALHYIAAALALAPDRSEHRNALDRILSQTRAPLALLNLPEKGAFYGLWAVRARALARAGRFAEAVSILFEVACQFPEVAYLPWAVQWLAPAKAARRVDLTEMAAEVLHYRQAAGRSRSAGVAINLQACADLLERLQRRDAHHFDVILTRSSVLRSLGKAREALALLESTRAEEQGADRAWDWAVERAAVSAALGDSASRCLWLERAHQLRPEDVSAALDLAGEALDQADAERAIRYYEQALSIEPDNVWARVGCDYARALCAQGNAMVASRPDALAHFHAELAASVEPVPERLRRRWEVLRRDLTAYDTRLPDPVDPAVALLRSVSAQLRQGGSGPLRVKARGCPWIAPSAQRAFRLQLQAADRQGTLWLPEGDRAGQPEPLLWQLDGERWLPKMPPPSRAVQLEIEALIDRPFVLAHWSQAALATRLTEADVDGLKGALVHLPALPSPAADAVRWVHAHQLAAALLIASLPSGGEAALALLSPLLTGQDWTEAAAWLGLLQLAGRHEALRPQVLVLLERHRPSAADALTPGARALAFVGEALASGSAQRPYRRLRARLVQLADWDSGPAPQLSS